MNLEQAGYNMVEQQIRPWEVLDQDVLDLLMTVRRDHFVPAACVRLAFADTAIPLGHGAAMLPPVRRIAPSLLSVALAPVVRTVLPVPVTMVLPARRSKWRGLEIELI